MVYPKSEVLGAEAPEGKTESVINSNRPADIRKRMLYIIMDAHLGDRVFIFLFIGYIIIHMKNNLYENKHFI